MPDPKIRVNWTVPAPVIMAIFANAALLAFVIGVWKSSVESSIELYRQEAAQRATVLEGRLAVLEKGVAANSAMIDRNAVLAERVKGVEVNIDALQKQSQRIEEKLDTALERKP